MTSGVKEGKKKKLVGFWRKGFGLFQEKGVCAQFGMRYGMHYGKKIRAVVQTDAFQEQSKNG